MKTKNIVKYIISALFIGLLAPAYAQQPDELNKEVQVTRAYDPIISDANKIEVPLKVDDTLTHIKKEFTYNVLSRGVASTYSIRPIPAATIIEQAYTDPHFLYARLGFGYPVSPLADIYINNYNPKSLSVGAYYNLRSIFGNIENSNPKGHDIPIDEMSHNAGAYIKNQFEHFTLGFNAGFKYHKLLFSGYDTGLNNMFDYKPNKDSLTQVYTTIDAKLYLTSNNKDANDFRYHIGASFNRFGDNGKNRFDMGWLHGMNENTIGGEIYLAKPFNDLHLFGLKADFNYYNRKLKSNLMPTETDSTRNRYHLLIEPNYTFKGDNFELLLGAKIDIAKEHDDKTKTYIRPHAELAYLLANEFTPYASINGGREMNTYQKIASENPYILPGMNFNMRNTMHDYKIRGGFKGNIQPAFSYNIYAGYSLIKNMYFFRNTPQPIDANSPYSLYNNFDVEYDEVQEFNAGAELNVNYSIVNASLKANYYNYNLSDLKAPFHRPEFTMDFNANLTIAQYLILSARLHAQSKTAYNYYALQDKTLYNDEFFDLGLGAEYLFSRNFSVFLNVNNLLNKKYMVWNLYRVPGIHVQGGITLSF